MNILMVTINFYPSVGGIETMTENLANEFVKMGNSVTVITNTPDDHTRIFPFKVMRNPSAKAIFCAFKDCDVFVHQSISLKYVWPLFILRKPFYIVHHMVGWESGIRGKVKKLFSYFAHNICVSKTVAIGCGLNKYDIIYNAYNDCIFKRTNTSERANIAFVGRISKEKGVYLLIEAFNEFKEKTHSDYKLDIIGDSNERQAIEEYAKETKYSSDIHFYGAKTPKQVAEALNIHKILAVTTTYPCREAFGIVCLEGLACGCIVVGADGDGIEESLHGCGVLYENGSQGNLAEKFALLQTKKYEVEKDLSEWLRSRELHNVAQEYIKVFIKNK